jgi:serine/threonine-protein kinase
VTRCTRCDAEVPEAGRFCPACGFALSSSLSHLPTEIGSTPKPVSPKPPSSVGRLVSSGSLDLGAFPPGAMLGKRYRIVGLLGRGGMGEVYRADDLKLGQAVALKFLPKAVSGDEALLARFHAEVRLARQVSHPNVCRIYDIGEIEGRHFLSMEYVDGEDLASLLKRIGHLPAEKAVEIARQLCAGLHAAHEKGVLHRDLKPANIMLDGRGRVRITDFGLAVAAEEAANVGEVSGTPAYMAPELLAGKPASVRSDLYALGLVLYEVATGKRAFDAPTLAEMKRKHEQETPAAPSAILAGFDPAVERVILRCLEKDPRARPSSAVQVAAALPGGDPLAAAIAAGETPSPEMVAAAGPEGVISTARAGALLAGVLALLTAIFVLSRWATDLGLSPLPKPPDVLQERAREVTRRLGYTETPGDSSGTFARDSSYLDFRARTSAPGWARRLAASWWKPATFNYRQSPRPLIPANVSIVTLADPPLNVTGMVTVILDPEGWLREFVAVPPQVPPSTPEPPATPMWEVLFVEAGLDPKAFTRSDPAWLPSVPFDAIAGWTGPMPGGKDVTLRVVAAAFRGRPVSFQIVAPWSVPDRDAATPVALRSRIRGATFSLTTLLIAGAAVWFARRNTRLGRGRDLLGGLFLGCGAVLVVEAIAATPAIFASGGETPLFFEPVALIGIRGVAGEIAGCGIDILMFSLASATLLFLGSLLLRKRPLAVSLVWVFWFAVRVGRENPIFEVPAGALIATLAVLALVRFGLLGIAAFVAVDGPLVATPITTDFSAWYAGYGAFFALVVLALALWGFWTARGGGSLFGVTALDG